MVPITAKADGGKEYTIILDPGEGTGEQIVYSANKTEITKRWREAGNCEFYLEDDGAVGFCLGDNYCPASFTAPEYMEIDGWEGKPAKYTPVSVGTTTYTAKWKTISDDLPSYEGDSICNISPVSNGTEYTFSKDRIKTTWRLIGKDETNNTGLLIYKGSNKITDLSGSIDQMPQLLNDIYNLFSDDEKNTIIPTSKLGNKYYDAKYDLNYIEDNMRNAKLFILSIGETKYYGGIIKKGLIWTRSHVERKEFKYAFVSSDNDEIRSGNKSGHYQISPAFQVDLNKLDALKGTQALPPALPEGTFLSKTGTYKITNKKKKEVQMIEGAVSLKGAVKVPKTVTYEKKKYKVTSLGGMLFDGNSELKTINITAGNLKKVGKFAFRFINSKAVFKIRGTKKQFKKIKKLIKASKGLPKGVKFRRVK